MANPPSYLIGLLKAEQEHGGDPVEQLLGEIRILSTLLTEREKRLGNGNNNKRFWGDTAARILSGVTTLLVAAMLFGLFSLDRRVALLEQDMFTVERARLMEERIMAGNPPVWFQNLVTAQGLQIAGLEARIRELERGR